MGLVRSNSVAVQLMPALRTRSMNASIKVKRHPDYAWSDWF
jgi:hypothetical protein